MICFVPSQSFSIFSSFIIWSTYYGCVFCVSEGESISFLVWLIHVFSCDGVRRSFLYMMHILWMCALFWLWRKHILPCITHAYIYMDGGKTILPLYDAHIMDVCFVLVMEKSYPSLYDSCMFVYVMEVRGSFLYMMHILWMCALCWWWRKHVISIMDVHFEFVKEKAYASSNDLCMFVCMVEVRRRLYYSLLLFCDSVMITCSLLIMGILILCY